MWRPKSPCWKKRADGESDRGKGETGVKKRQAGSQFASVTAVFFSFLLAMLLLVILGSSSYRDTVAGMEGNQAARAGRAYLLTKLRSGDQAGMVAVETGAARDVLVLSERAEDEVFETRIYLANGNLVEEYLPAGEGGDPSLAQVVCPAGQFSARREGDTLHLQIDGSAFSYALRSTEEGEP